LADKEKYSKNSQSHPPEKEILGQDVVFLILKNILIFENCYEGFFLFMFK